MKLLQSLFAPGCPFPSEIEHSFFSQSTGIEVLTLGTTSKYVEVNNDFYIFKFWQVKNSREENTFFTLQNNST
ncbi:hypothetical protein SAMN04488034_101385 [Salinimicrobium catena]|uniref:Uncharacterized protein n=1 Tax=Salinimicrobium catena TaxID=390640 RepID=A0A1H5IBR4_9FLAO|nr:hypothetical protein SAMN04488140_101385 [Salinimicrobium catena]SEE37620.1 hypothetical protein SAMN04488034_101385 [Salinimicrobium catena]